MLRQIARTVPRSTSQIRTIITARSVDEPSANYRPGKEGFAPGMPHPPGASASPAPPPPPRTVESLPEMSKKHEIRARGNPEQRFKYEMTKLRHSYQRDHVEGEQAKRELNARHRQGSLKRLQARQAAERAENEKRLSFERLMQPNGDVMAETGVKHQEQIMEFVKERKIKRLANLRQVEEKASEARVEALIRLYHASEGFVTMENLDAKVDEFYNTWDNMLGKTYVDTVADLMNDVNEYGQITFSDQTKREQELKDALGGTVSGGKIGYARVQESISSE